MTKKNIEDAIHAGIKVIGPQVASVSKDRRTMTMLHRWGDEDVARRVNDVARRWARDVAKTHGRPVEIYAAEGWMIDQIGP